MNEKTALDALGALSQQTRMSAFRLLVASEPEGLPAGEIARTLAVPQNTMSTHLAALAQCGLIKGQRFSRSIIYRADLAQFRALLVYLVQNCCGGSPEVCAPLLADIASGCPPSRRKDKSRR